MSTYGSTNADPHARTQIQSQSELEIERSSLLSQNASGCMDSEYVSNPDKLTRGDSVFSLQAHITAFKRAFVRQSLFEYLTLWVVGATMVYLKLSHPTPRTVKYVNYLDYVMNHEDLEIDPATNHTYPGIHEYLTYDPSISKPHVSTEGFPSWAGYVAPMVLFYFCLAATELVYQQLHVRKSLTVMYSNIMFYIIDSSVATCISMLLAEVLKTSVGILRPDFLSRCKPDPYTGECSASNLDKLVKGRYSFPSGHATSGFAFAIYCAAYIIYTWYVRIPREVRQRRVTSSKRLLDTLAGCGFYFVIFMVAFAWGMGASRINDNRHSVQDIIAGALLGGVYGALFGVRAVFNHADVNEEDRDHDTSVGSHGESCNNKSYSYN